MLGVEMITKILFFASIAILILFPRVAIAKDGFDHYGSWSSVTGQDSPPQAEGYLLDLWRYNGAVFGILSRYLGPRHTPSVGEVEDLILNEKTGEISFKAKMSLGVARDRSTGQSTPSKVTYTFHGIKKRNSIEGTMEQQAHDSVDSTSVGRKVVLRSGRTKIAWEDSTYEGWKEYIAPIIKAQGPKW